MEIIIGTRGSKLALWQAYFIQDKLKKAGAKTNIKVIETKGDKILNVALSKIGSKGVFTEELEEQLLSGQIDIAVHSAKDLQSDLGENFELIAFTEREKINDVVVSLNKNNKITDGKKIMVGTSSTRRVAMIKAYYPHVTITDMRGNLQTRIAKMERGDCDALLLAYAGVHRMKYHEMISEELNPDLFTPAVGQGTVAIESKIGLNDDKKDLIRKACNDENTEKCLLAERAFLKKINGGCSIPVFGNAVLVNNVIEMQAGIVSLDGKEMIRVDGKNSNPELLGVNLALELLEKGGSGILETIRANMA